MSGDMPVDVLNRATEIRTCSFKRPHMRSFWFATAGFFVAFVGWFAFAPLMVTVKKELGISKSEIYTANILAVSATIVMRVIIGPMCDRFGARRLMAGLLLATALPVACGAFVTNATGLMLDRFFVSFAGATFVPCQFWTMAMFAPNVVGQANAMAGGWGNLGGGFVQAFLPAVFELFKAFGASDDLSWRLSLLVPAVFFIILGLSMLKFSDDCPEGKWADRVEVARGGAEQSKGEVFKQAVLNRNTIILIWAYACCFGIELFVNNAASLFLYEQFIKSDCIVTADDGCHVLTQATAGLIASLFGLMNLFARAIGGILSDKASRKYGIGGRFRVLMFTSLGTGLMMILFSQMTILPIAMVCLVLFSVNVQAAEGASFGIVPFVDPANKGVVSGLVGAGGNLGAVIWGLIYKEFGSKDQERTGMLVIGCIVTGSALMCLGLKINGAAMFWGEEGEEPGEKHKESSDPNKKPPTPIQTKVQPEGAKDMSDDEA